MSTEIECISFFATAGRGTESFVANEITKKLIPREISARDGKVFFKLSSATELNIKKILALRSVERVFVGITDYNNVAYIISKKTFLDKLMCTVAAQENISNAKTVLAELSKNPENNTEDANMSKSVHNSCVSTLEGHCGRSLTRCSCSKGLHHPAKTNCTGMKRADTSSCRQDLESSSCVESRPAEKYRKFDVSLSQTTEVSDCERRILFDKSSDGARQTDLECEYQDVLSYSPKCDNSIDYKCATQAVVCCSQIRQTESNCDHTVELGCAKQTDSNLERCSNQDSENETVNSNLLSHKCVLRCNTKYKDNQQQIVHQHNSITEGNSNNADKESLSFRMSIKCSGKVSKWLNIKKLSRDLGWRVARTTGWKVDLRKPQFEVCVHISDEHVTVGIPLTRFPLSRRVYMADFGLRAPIAWIMSQLCSIKPGDIVLDPMCGKATILLEASSDVKDAWFLGSDSDSSQTDKALQNLKTCSHSRTVSLLKADGLRQAGGLFYNIFMEYMAIFSKTNFKYRIKH